MSIQEARKAAKQSLMGGYRHHAYENERQQLYLFLRGKLDAPHFSLSLPTYADILAPERWRALKNSVICFVTVVCRAAIDNGVDSEYSFAISDYYLNKIENAKSEAELEALVQELVFNYRDLVLQEQDTVYSRPVALALRYIYQNLYEPCRVADVAAFAGVHPNYLSRAFKKEVGASPSDFILRHKIDEAKTLLVQTRQPVGEIAEALGFCSAAHFSARFKALVGVCPRAYSR